VPSGPTVRDRRQNGSSVADKSPGKAKDSSSLFGEGREVIELVRDYAVQEIKAPLAGAIRFLAFGLAGAVLIGLGSSLVMLGILRFLQTETGKAFDGHLSFVPYLIVVVLCAGIIALAASRMGSKEPK
jgi:hypothetical protein